MRRVQFYEMLDVCNLLNVLQQIAIRKTLNCYKYATTNILLRYVTESDDRQNPKLRESTQYELPSLVLYLIKNL